MARRLTAQLILAAAYVAAAVAPGSEARAQTLPRLTVESFVLSADTVQPQLDQPFHIMVTLRVREQVSEITNLELPSLAHLELLGDERQLTGDASGTKYREIITVVGHTYGPMTVAPARLQAIDARDGKAKEWQTNDLSISVGSPRAQIINGLTTALLVNVVRIFAVLLWVLLLGGIGVLAVILIRRKNVQAVAVPQPAVPEPAVAPPTRKQQVADALLVLSAERTRPAAVRVRAAIWRIAGASEGETLGDVLRLPGSDDVPLRDVLVALERSAFTYDEDLRAAIDDACAALERYAAGLT
jgi:hypothetical protein